MNMNMNIRAKFHFHLGHQSTDCLKRPRWISGLGVPRIPRTRYSAIRAIRAEDKRNLMNANKIVPKTHTCLFSDNKNTHEYEYDIYILNVHINSSYTLTT